MQFSRRHKDPFHWPTEDEIQAAGAAGELLSDETVLNIAQLIRAKKGAARSAECLREDVKFSSSASGYGLQCDDLPAAADTGDTTSSAGASPGLRQDDLPAADSITGTSSYASASFGLRRDELPAPADSGTGNTTSYASSSFGLQRDMPDASDTGDTSLASSSSP